MWRSVGSPVIAKSRRVTLLDEEIRRSIGLLLGLLVRNDDEDDTHVGLVAELLDGAHHRRKPALHVVGAAAVEPVALDAGRELLGTCGNDVDVTV